MQNNKIKRYDTSFGEGVHQSKDGDLIKRSELKAMLEKELEHAVGAYGDGLQTVYEWLDLDNP